MEVLGHLTPKNVFTTITAPFNIWLFVRKPQVAVPRCTICVHVSALFLLTGMTIVALYLLIIDGAVKDKKKY